MPEIVQRPRLAQLPRGSRAESQADGILAFRLDPFLDSKRMAIQRIESLRPIFAWMNIGAVGEVQSVI